MKKILIATATAALFTVSGAALAQERVIASADLNVRAGPGTSHPIVGTLGANDAATVLDCAQASNWCRISYGGGEGWVSSNYLMASGEAGVVRSGGSGVATGATTGAIGGAIIGGPVGAVVGGVAGGAIGAGTDAGGSRNTGAVTGATTGAIGGAIIGGPVGAVVGGIAGGTLGAGADVASEPVDDVVVGSTVPDTIPLSAIPTHASDRTPEFMAVDYGGHRLWVETSTGRVINVLR